MQGPCSIPVRKWWVWSGLSVEAYVSLAPADDLLYIVCGRRLVDLPHQTELPSKELPGHFICNKCRCNLIQYDSALAVDDAVAQHRAQSAPLRELLQDRAPCMFPTLPRCRDARRVLAHMPDQGQAHTTTPTQRLSVAPPRPCTSTALSRSRAKGMHAGKSPPACAPHVLKMRPVSASSAEVGWEACRAYAG